jgi:hypothetical protein
MKPEEKTEPIDDGIHLEARVDEIESQVKEGLLGHQWVQRGPFLVCKSCPIEHGIYIGVDRQLVGLNDDGTPKLKKITED